jgi:iron complex outermembrane recepter protein
MMTAACIVLGAPLCGAMPVASARADAPAAPAAQVRYFRIADQGLVAALNEFGRQSGRDILFSTDVAGRKRSTAVNGAMTAEQALRTLLTGTGLTFRATSERTFLVEFAARQPPAPDQQADPKEQPTEDDKKVEDDRKVERVVVTGTNIRGRRPKSSPLDIYTAKDIERSGATTTEQFIQKLPQNLGTRTGSASNSSNLGSNGARNREGINGVDLRGLGVGTTLVLINGRRPALASFGQAVDISLIPVSAVERVEILTDGASAIYGSDAIGGVINFVLRDEFDGVETRASYGGVTSGGLHQFSATQTMGHNWTSGNALLSYDYLDASPLKVEDRSYAVPAGPGYLSPEDQRHGVLIAASQELGADVTIGGEFLFSRRNVETASSALTNPAVPTFSTSASATDQYLTNVGLDFLLSDSLSAVVQASHAQIDIDSRATGKNLNTQSVTTSAWDTNYSAYDVTAMLNGSLFSLPGGPVRFSIGAGGIDEEYKGARTDNGQASGRIFSRMTLYGFGELLAPLVAREQGIPLVDRLELSLAARYTSYEDTSEPALAAELGSKVSPKIGLFWGPFPSLGFRGTYSESFRAPTFTETDPSAASNTLAGNFNIGGVPSTLLAVQGPSNNIVPETAESFTLGLDYNPTSRPTLQLSATYFSIDYIDRITGTGQFNGAALANPAAWPEKIYRPASVAFVEELLRSSRNLVNTSGISLADPHAAATALVGLSNFWFLDSRVQNLALSELDGVDFSFRDQVETSWGDLRVGGNVTMLLDYREQLTQSAPVLTVVDTLLRPVDLRGRVYLGLTHGDLDTTLSINYVDDYRNPYPPGGAQTVESWTTVDLSAVYEFEGETMLDGLRLSLSVQNLFDEDPPFIARSSNTSQGLVNPVGFDTANANPLGRFVAFGISKRW